VVGKEGLNLLINNAGLLPANRDLDVSILLFYIDAKVFVQRRFSVRKLIDVFLFILSVFLLPVPVLFTCQSLPIVQCFGSGFSDSGSGSSIFRMNIDPNPDPIRSKVLMTKN
jgi:hypothetical protein